MDILPTHWIFGAAGLLLGAGLSWVVAGQRASQREARLVAAAREQVAQSTQAIRAAHSKLQAEVEKERAAAAASSGPQAQLEQQRSLVQRLQAQLRAANAEIDRLQPTPASPPAGQTLSIAPGILLPEDQTDPDGFAMTRPFER